MDDPFGNSFIILHFLPKIESDDYNVEIESVFLMQHDPVASIFLKHKYHPKTSSKDLEQGDFRLAVLSFSSLTSF